MIGSLRGSVLERLDDGRVLIEVGGVGYLVTVTPRTLAELEPTSPVFLYVHHHIREDAQLLFGFLSADERSTFRLLIKISGVGPRTALSILSGLSVAELAQAIAAQEAGRLVKVPGIGKKTAERLLLELKGKLGDALAAPASLASHAQGDILQALVALGYSDREASAAQKALPADIGVSDGIKLALKQLAK